MWLSVWIAASMYVTFCHGALRWKPLLRLPVGLPNVVTTPISFVGTTTELATARTMTASVAQAAETR